MGIIYKAENKINGNVYIGQTILNFKTRKRTHKNNAARGGDCVFHMAIRKHGFDNFKWSILSKTDSKSKLNAMEKFYIAAYKKMTKVYNMTSGGDGSSGYSHSEKTKIKISIARTGLKIGPQTKENRLKKSIALKGRVFSEETRRKMSESAKKKTLTEEHKNNIRLAGIGRKHSEETKKKMSLAAMGEKNHNFGKKLNRKKS